MLTPENRNMFEDYEKKKRKQVSGMKSMMDYGMGLLMIVAGVVLVFRDKFHLGNQSPPTSLDKIFGISCMLYGAWRIYRGYKKNYFR